jgi:hypothetical protein
VGFSTGMLSLYCSIAKASVLRGWLRFEEKRSEANAREIRELFLIRIPLHQMVSSMRKLGNVLLLNGSLATLEISEENYWLITILPSGVRSTMGA